MFSYRARLQALAAALLCVPTLAIAKDASIEVPVGVNFVSPAIAPSFKRVDVRSLPAAPPWQPGDPIREIPKRFETPPVVAPQAVNPIAGGVDRLAELQRRYDASQRSPLGSGFDVPTLNFPSIGNTGVQPSDVNGDIGKDHFVNSVNGSGGARIAIYDKLTGAQIGPTFSLDALGTGGPCANGLGDAIILYDELAERWLLTEFVSGGNDLCLYLSDGSDPTNAVWTRYNFTMPSFPDYPKYGVWSDAYYAGANESGTGGARPIYAFDRARMLAGQSATFQRLTIPRLNGFGFQMIQPADHDGKFSPPPAGAPGIFMRHRDDEAHNAGNNNPSADFLELWELDVDFTTPANTVLSPVQTIQIDEFDSNLNGLSAFNAFPQPNGQKLDPLREVIMHRLAYRNMGSFEVLVGNLVTDVDGNDTGGIRWFELRRNGGPGNPWTLFQEGTYAPADAGGPADRWMGGIAMDETGNMALGYSITRQSPGIFPGLRYVGRITGDPAGVMTTAENIIVNGGGSQGGERWGDYHSMSVDPEDGCTFWFTGNLVPSSSWATQVAAFRHDACGSPTFVQSGDNLNQSICATPAGVDLDPINLNVTPLNGFGDPVSLSFEGGLPSGFSGSFDPTMVIPPGASLVQLSVNNTAAVGQNAVILRGSAGAITRDTQLNVNVLTEIPVAPGLTSPADAASNIPTVPTFSWSASAQAESYLIEVATDPGFNDIVLSETANGTSFQPSSPLNTSTTYYWRVSAGNICGNDGPAEVYSFLTVPAPGDCGVGNQVNAEYEYGFEAGPGGWTSSGTGNTWAQSNQRVNSGSFSWKAVDPATTSDQRLVSPTILLPSDQAPLTFQFFQYRDIEESGTTQCWDAGILEISSNGGANWTQVPTADILADPYTGLIRTGTTNPLAGLQGWCNLQDWTRTIVDMDDYAGQTVQFRFRLGSDASVGAEGWYIDDVRVQSCGIGDNVFNNGFED